MSRRVSSLQRVLDRLVGIPLVAAFALAPKRRAPDSQTIRRIGVLKTAALGDTLLLSGMLRAIRGRFPAAAVILITGPDNAQVAPLLDDSVDEHVTIAPRSPAAALRAVRGLELDVLLECGPWPRFDALLAALSGARYRVGFRVRGQARHFAFDAVVDHSSSIHQFENFQRLAASIGVSEFPLPSINAPGLVRVGETFGESFAVFHPWSGGHMGHAKEWPSPSWVALGRRLAAASDLHLLVSGGPGDVAKSEELARALTAAGARATSIAGRYSFAELADVLAAAAVVVSVNTGVMHLSGLVGAPTVSLEGPAALRRWRPIGPRVRSVVSTFSDREYLDLGFEYAGHRLDTMEGVSVDAVIAAIDDLRRSS